MLDRLAGPRTFAAVDGERTVCATMLTNPLLKLGKFGGADLDVSALGEAAGFGDVSVWTNRRTTGAVKNHVGRRNGAPRVEYIAGRVLGEPLLIRKIVAVEHRGHNLIPGKARMRSNAGVKRRAAFRASAWTTG